MVLHSRKPSEMLFWWLPGQEVFMIRHQSYMWQFTPWFYRLCHIAAGTRFCFIFHTTQFHFAICRVEPRGHGGTRSAPMATARRWCSRARQCEGRLHNTDIQSNKCLYVTSKSFSKHTCLSNLSQFYQLQKRIERGIKWSTCLNCLPVSLSVSLHGMLRRVMC